ncbi:MAG: hypothetical protein AB1410_00845 [Acidobacteriota bacterium]
MQKINRIIFISITILIFLLSLSAVAKEKKKNEERRRNLPPKVIKEVEEGLKTLQSNGVFNLEELNTFYFPAQMEKTYAVILFRAELIKDAEEIKKEMEKKFEEMKKEKGEEEAEKKGEEQQKIIPAIPTYHFFLQIYRKSEDAMKLYLEYYSPMPFENQDPQYYSFGIPLDPGDYIFAWEVSRRDLTKYGTFFFKLDVPSMVFKNLNFSPPFFLKDLKALPAVQTVFTVHKDNFVVSQASMYPYLTNQFRVEEMPTLFFYILGAGVDEISKAVNLEMHITIKKEDKEVLKYAAVSFTHPVVAQPVIFKTPQITLEKGNYILEAEIIDKIGNQKNKSHISFEIIE